MQIQRIQNNNNNTQFKGTLILYDRKLPKTKKMIIKKRISKNADKELYYSAKRLLGKESMRGLIGLGGNNFNGRNERNYKDYLGYINILLNINPAEIELDNNLRFNDHYYIYDGKENEQLTYAIELNDRYVVEHISNVYKLI